MGVAKGEFVCKSLDWDTFVNSTQNHTEYHKRDPFGGDVAVLGPYVDPITERVTVRCIDLESFDVDQIKVSGIPSQVNFGLMFSIMDRDYAMEPGIPVPTAAMLEEFIEDLDEYAELCTIALARRQKPDIFPQQSLYKWLESIGMEQWHRNLSTMDYRANWHLTPSSETINALRRVFESVDIPTEDIDIISHALRLETDWFWTAKYNKLHNLSAALQHIHTVLVRNETRLDALQKECNKDAAFQKHARTIARLFFEIALYSRRWAGPDQPFPISKLPAAVGTPSNPLSDRLQGKYAIPTLTGVRLKDIPDDQRDNFRAADVVDEYGMLQRMQQACGASIMMIFETLPPRQRTALRDAMTLGYHMYQIDGSGYWQSYDEVNTINGNPNFLGGPFQLDIFQMYFGTTTTDNDAFYAQSSVQGTGTYCVQIAAQVAGRTILSIIPSLYKTRPAWAAHEGVWINLHT